MRGEQWLGRKKGRAIGKTGQGNEVGEDEQLDRDERKVGDRLSWGGGGEMGVQQCNFPSLQDKTITPSSLPGEVL
jgi:hypothetical protein